MLLTFEDARGGGRVHLDPFSVRSIREVEARGQKAAIVRLEDGEVHTVRDDERTAVTRINEALDAVPTGPEQPE